MKPLQILFVDDEHFVIRGINSLIDWKSNGFTEPLAAHSGEAALALMERQPVDVVITDVKMAPMDGLELLREIKRRGYKCEVIILSCHSEYALSRAAIQNGACDYLFKPEMMPEDILRSVKAAAERLAMRQTEDQKVEHLRERLTEKEASVKHAVLLDLMDGRRMTLAQFQEELRPFPLAFPPDAVDVALIRVTDPKVAFSGGKTEYQFKSEVLAKITQALDPPGAYETLARDAMHYLLICASELSALHSRQRLRKQIYMIFDSLRTDLHLEAVCGVARLRQPIVALGEIYGQAYACATHAMRAGLVVFHDELPIAPQNDGSWIGELLQMYADMRQEDHDARIRRIFGLINQRTEVSREMLIELSAGILSMLLEGPGKEAGALSLVYERQERLFSNLYSLFTIDMFEDYLLTAAHAAESGGNIKRLEIKRACAYLHKNLSNPALSLNEVAHHAGMSKNYFSLIFKEETGEGFAQYLTRIRLESAQELMRTTSMKVYQIAEAVGFSDWRYLTRVYKKQFGHNLTGQR